MSLSQIDFARLNKATREDIHAQLQLVRLGVSPTAITAHLTDWVDSKTVDLRVLDVWEQCQDDKYAYIVTAMCEGGAGQRRAGMRRFCKALTQDSTFADMWREVGGAPGLTKIMMTWSVRDVKAMCGKLRRTATARGAAGLRRVALGQLLASLCAENGGEPRPLRRYYDNIALAATEELADKWQQEEKRSWTPRQRVTLLRAHPKTYRAQLLDQIGSPGPSDNVDLKAARPLMEDSMEFTLVVLAKLAETESNIGNSVTFLESFAKPLVQRLCRRKSDHRLRVKVLGLLVRCMQQHTVSTWELDIDGRGLLHYAIKLWESVPPSQKADMQAHIATLITLLPPERKLTPDSILNVVRQAKPRVRYELSCLVLKHAKCFGIDIVQRSTEDLDKVSVMKDWPPQLFLVLAGSENPTSSLRLLDMLMLAHPDGSFLNYAIWNSSSDIFGQARDPEDERVDPMILHTYLTRSLRSAKDMNAEWFRHVEAAINGRRRKAAGCREWQDRAFWVKSTVRLSVALGTLDILENTVIWARRFNKDALTVREIYDFSVLGSSKTLDLLSCISKDALRANHEIAALKASIEHANRISIQLLETAAMAVREPSFQASNWTSIIRLPANIAKRRLELVNHFQDTFELSDNEVFDIVWGPTLELLLHVEHFMLMPNQEPFGFQSLAGLLTGLQSIKNLRRTSDRFLDCLAERRDNLWKALRPKYHPAVISLELPWPLGLPVQFLWPQGLKGHHHLPFVQRKAEAIVFLEASKALSELPQDAELRSAIGPFVDKFGFALGIYLHSQPEESADERLAHARKAWNYATGPLSESWMTEVEAVRFWRPIFRDATGPLTSEELQSWLSIFQDDGPDPLCFKGKLPKAPILIFPDDAGTGEPVEWDPDPYHAERSFPSRILEPTTTIDCMLSNSLAGYAGTIHGTFQERSSSINELRFGGFWSQRGIVPGLAAVLFLNAKYGMNSSLTMKPRRQRGDKWLPAVFLDQEFLERQENLNLRRVILALKRQRKAISLSLIADLTSSLLTKMKSNTENVREQTLATMSLIKMLARSSEPWLACSFIQEILLERQDDSAWHRELLTQGFLNSLPATKATQFMVDLAFAIGRKLAEQNARPKESSSEPRPPAVKVTTVKMVAERLRGAPFISPSTACDLLVCLLVNAQHIDIRTTAIESLLSILMQPASSSQLQRKLLQILETHAVPLAASLNERITITETDWNAAETDGPMLDVDIGSNTPPILSLFLGCNKRQEWGQISKEARSRIAQVVMSILEQSTVTNTRWTRLFMKKHAFSLPPSQQLPELPVKLEMLLNIFRTWLPYMPRSAFETLKAAALLDPVFRPIATSINEKVKTDPVLVQSNAGKHWLEQQDHKWRDTLRLISKEAARILNRNEQNFTGSWITDGVTVKMLQDLVYDAADVLIADGDTNSLEGLVREAAVLKGANRGYWLAWHDRCTPVLRRILTRVEALRADVSRGRGAWRWSPTVLPSLCRLRILMLPVPYAEASDESGLRKTYKSFLVELDGLIDGLATATIEKGVPYHDDWVFLKAEAQAWCVTSNILASALWLGSIAKFDVPEPRLADRLRVELAGYLVLETPIPRDHTIREPVLEVVQKWRGCEAEDVRIIALMVEKKIRDLEL